VVEAVLQTEQVVSEDQVALVVAVMVKQLLPATGMLDQGHQIPALVAAGILVSKRQASQGAQATAALVLSSSKSHLRIAQSFHRV
jgi:hypothetical protein